MSRREQIAEIIDQYDAKVCREKDAPWFKCRGYECVKDCGLCVADRILALGLDSCPLRQEYEGAVRCKRDGKHCTEAHERSCDCFPLINKAIKGESDG